MLKFSLSPTYSFLQQIFMEQLHIPVPVLGIVLRGGFLGDSVVKNLPALQETWVFGKIPWRREWQPTPAFMPQEFQEQRSLVGYSPWGLKESDLTKQLTLSLFHFFQKGQGKT